MRSILRTLISRRMYRIYIDAELCTRCYMCVKVCQKGALRVEENGEAPVIYRENLCTLCLSCVLVCPVGAAKVKFCRS